MKFMFLSILASKLLFRTLFTSFFFGWGGVCQNKFLVQNSVYYCLPECAAFKLNKMCVVI